MSTQLRHVPSFCKSGSECLKKLCMHNFVVVHAQLRAAFSMCTCTRMTLIQHILRIFHERVANGQIYIFFCTLVVRRLHLGVTRLQSEQPTQHDSHIATHSHYSLLSTRKQNPINKSR